MTVNVPVTNAPLNESSTVSVPCPDTIVELAGAAEVKGRSEPLKMYKVRGYRENGMDVVVRTEYSDYEAEKVDKVKVSA